MSMGRWGRTLSPEEECDEALPYIISMREGERREGTRGGENSQSGGSMEVDDEIIGGP